MGYWAEWGKKHLYKTWFIPSLYWMKPRTFTLLFHKEINPLQKSSILENCILEPEPQPVKAGNGKFGCCWPGLSWPKSTSVETPRQRYSGGSALQQARWLSPRSTCPVHSWFLPSSHLSLREPHFYSCQIPLSVVISLLRTIIMAHDGTNIFKNQNVFSSDGSEIIRVIIKALFKNQITYDVIC